MPPESIDPSILGGGGWGGSSPLKSVSLLHTLRNQRMALGVKESCRYSIPGMILIILQTEMSLGA